MNLKLFHILRNYHWRNLIDVMSAAQHCCSLTVAKFFVTGRTFADYIARKFAFSTSTRVIGKNVVVGVTHRRRCVVRLAMRVLELAKRRWKSEIQHRPGRRGRRQRRFRPTMLVNLCRKRTPTTTTTTTKNDDAERLGRPSWSRAGDGPVFI